MDETSENGPRRRDWEQILHEFKPRVARVRVWDTHQTNGQFRSRYVIAKEMTTAKGRFVITQAYRQRRDAALAYGRKWFADRTLGKEAAHA